MIIAVAAIVIAVASIAANLWAVNQSRMLRRWTRDGCLGPMPKWWHVRYKPAQVPVWPFNVETTSAIMSHAIRHHARRRG